MQILQNYDLTTLNTFKVKAEAKFFVSLETEDDIKELFDSPEFKNNSKLFLGGGSNILFTKDFDGIVVLNRLKGIEIIKEDQNDVLIKSMAGVSWNDLVNFIVDKGYWGIENLALIPGTVGAAPVQNIGAYGSEIKDIIENVETVEISTGMKKVFSKEECKFGYRDSVFKSELTGKYFIVSVTFKLNKNSNKNIEYKVLKEYLEKNKIEVNNPKDISEAVSEIRRSKLPDPVLIGNAGSFFKNIFLEDKEKLEQLLQIYPDMPFFKEENITKIPSGWLIEQCGWKGKRVGNVGVHDKQALVLVNYGGATGGELKNLANHIIDSVFTKFGLKLVPEVNFI